MNLMHIDSGEIRLFGKSHIVATSEIKQKIGFVYDGITFTRIFL
jgi:ABC-type multidrug transport system ATPase subunit